MSNTTIADGTLIITVYGQPAPKGSLRHVGRGRMVEQVQGSKPWRQAVKAAALDARLLDDQLDQRRWHPTITGPVEVTVTITVRKPLAAPKNRRTWPATRSSGDTDKHARNILDALVDAAAIRDDAQVVALHVAKTYPNEHIDALDSPGARIVITPILDSNED